MLTIDSLLSSVPISTSSLPDFYSSFLLTKVIRTLALNERGRKGRKVAFIQSLLCVSCSSHVSHMSLIQLPNSPLSGY